MSSSIYAYCPKQVKVRLSMREYRSRTLDPERAVIDVMSVFSVSLDPIVLTIWCYCGDEFRAVDVVIHDYHSVGTALEQFERNRKALAREKQ